MSEENTIPLSNLIIGASLALASSCLSSLAINLQSNALHQQRLLNNLSEQQTLEDLDIIPQEGFDGHQSFSCSDLITNFRKYYLQTQWYIGFILYVLCQVFGSVFALWYISPMILAPLGSTGLIFNILFNSFFQGIPISFYDFLGTLLIVGGCAVVSLFGSKIPQPRQTIPTLIRLFTRPAFLAYMAVQIALVVSICGIIVYLKYHLETLKETISRSVSRRSSRVSISENRDPNAPVLDNSLVESPSVLERNFSQSSLVRFAEGSEHTPLLRNNTGSIRSVRKGQMSQLIGILYSSLGGIVASLTLLLTKSGLELLIRVIVDSEDQIHVAFAILMLFLTILTAFFQVYSLNMALKYELPLIVLPVFFAFFSCLSLTNTMVYLDAFAFASVGDFLLLVFGLVILISGVSMLGKQEDRPLQ